MIVKCNFCQEEIDLPPSRAMVFKYCSIKCRRSAKRAQKPCEICGKIMSGYKSDLENKRFCSNVCRREWQLKNKEIFSTRKSTTKIEKICPVCKNNFLSWRASNRTYCSKKCWQIDRALLIKGKKSPLWKTNKKSSTIRKLAKKYLGDYCAVCHWSEASCDSHHIIQNQSNGSNTLRNIIILCPNHHRMADEHIITEQELNDLWTKEYSSLQLDSAIIN